MINFIDIVCRVLSLVLVCILLLGLGFSWSAYSPLKLTVEFVYLLSLIFYGVAPRSRLDTRARFVLSGILIIGILAILINHSVSLSQPLIDNIPLIILLTFQVILLAVVIQKRIASVVKNQK